MNITAHHCTIEAPGRAARRATAISRIRDAHATTLPALCGLLGIPRLEGGEGERFLHRRVKAGQWIFSAGETLDAVFAVHAGSLKTLLIDASGNEQILGFPQRGDLLGMDGIFSGRHASHAIALTDCELVVIPFHELAASGPAGAALETWLYRATSRELAREHALVGLLGALSADERMARFLVSLSDRFAAAGYSPRAFRLAMTRKDIGNYLGLTLETASRTLSALDASGLIAVDQREIEILDLDALRNLRRIPAPAAKATKTARAMAATANRAARDSIWDGLEARAA